jgi:low molecular weight protein-tyrosine phosphatase
MAGLLFVCTANECRSALAAAIFSADLSGCGVPVVSRGLHVRPGAEMCSIALKKLESRPAALAIGRSHRAAQLTLDDLAAAHLVLVATRRQRAIVASMDPPVRPTLFTIREAARLATVADQDPPSERSIDGIAAVQRFAALLDNTRGLAQVGEASTRPDGFWRRRRLSRAFRDQTSMADDVPDAHLEGDKNSHRLAFDLLLGAVDQLDSALCSIWLPAD